MMQIISIITYYKYAPLPENTPSAGLSCLSRRCLGAFPTFRSYFLQKNFQRPAEYRQTTARARQ